MKNIPCNTAVYGAAGLFLCALPFFCNAYWLDVCVSIGLYALLALSLNVILGQAGIFHMGHAAFFAVGAYTTAILNTVCHWPVLWVMPLSGAACGHIRPGGGPSNHPPARRLPAYRHHRYCGNCAHCPDQRRFWPHRRSQRHFWHQQAHVLWLQDRQKHAVLFSGLGHGGAEPAAVLRPVALALWPRPQLHQRGRRGRRGLRHQRDPLQAGRLCAGGLLGGHGGHTLCRKDDHHRA